MRETQQERRKERERGGLAGGGEAAAFEPPPMRPPDAIPVRYRTVLCSMEGRLFTLHQSAAVRPQLPPAPRAPVSRLLMRCGGCVCVTQWVYMPCGVQLPYITQCGLAPPPPVPALPPPLGATMSPQYSLALLPFRAVVGHPLFLCVIARTVQVPPTLR